MSGTAAPGQRLCGSARGLLDPEAKGDDGGEPDDADDERVAVEVLLGDRRPGEAGRNATAEHARQAAALATVQQDEQRQQHARNDQERDEDVREHYVPLASRWFDRA